MWSAHAKNLARIFFSVRILLVLNSSRLVAPLPDLNEQKRGETTNKNKRLQGELYLAKKKPVMRRVGS